MNTNTSNTGMSVAGQLTAECACCNPPQLLVHHLSLGAVRMVCPTSRHTYLDRGDGMFQPDGATLSAEALRSPAPPTPAVTAQVVSPSAGDLLGDRPTRTADKVRISLEKATFAGSRP
jgi:hypothetical protein